MLDYLDIKEYTPISTTDVVEYEKARKRWDELGFLMGVDKESELYKILVVSFENAARYLIGLETQANQTVRDTFFVNYLGNIIFPLMRSTLEEYTFKPRVIETSEVMELLSKTTIKQWYRMFLIDVVNTAKKDLKDGKNKYHITAYLLSTIGTLNRILTFIKYAFGYNTDESVINLKGVFNSRLQLIDGKIEEKTLYDFIISYNALVGENSSERTKKLSKVFGVNIGGVGNYADEEAHIVKTFAHILASKIDEDEESPYFQPNFDGNLYDWLLAKVGLVE